MKECFRIVFHLEQITRRVGYATRGIAMKLGLVIELVDVRQDAQSALILQKQRK